MSPELIAVGFFTILVTGWMSALSLLFISAPYGRHDRPGYGPSVPQRLAWVLMEAPSLLCFCGALVAAGGPRGALGWSLAALWIVHYGHRTLVYPWLIRPRPGAGMKALLVLMAVFFNVLNGVLNGHGVASIEGGPGGLAWAGLALAVLGFGVNLHSDAILRGLRPPGATGYVIPTGGLYRWVSCPNYFGELLEWTGFALAAGTPFAWGFVFFTAANLIPRALTTHGWYRERFPDYPVNRRAVLPGIL